MHQKIVLQILQNSKLSNHRLILHYYISYIIHKKYVFLQLYECFQSDRIFQFFHCYQFFYLSQAKFSGLKCLVQNLLFVFRNIFCFYQDQLVQKEDSDLNHLNLVILCSPALRDLFFQLFRLKI